MANFIEVLDSDNLQPGRCTTVTLEGRNIALYNVDGEIYATDDACMHAGSSLGWGILEGKFIRCRAHGMRYDVTTGKVMGEADAGVKSYETEVRDGKIRVAVD
ncbi:MAG TPA: Rieske (2Fe-2S) protein [Candidatus Tumulicola sp.]